MSVLEETDCTRCIHGDVCSYKETFLTAQKTVEEVLISVNGGCKRLTDFTYIKPVRLQCHYYKAAEPKIKANL